MLTKEHWKRYWLLWVLGLLFAYFVWPTPWVRISDPKYVSVMWLNRFTGKLAPARVW